MRHRTQGNNLNVGRGIFFCLDGTGKVTQREPKTSLGYSEEERKLKQLPLMAVLQNTFICVTAA